MLQQRHNRGFPDLRANVDAFTQRVEHAHKNKPNIGYCNKPFYHIARDLMFTFFKYQHLTSDNQEESIRLKSILIMQANNLKVQREATLKQAELLAQKEAVVLNQSHLLEQKEEAIAEKIHDIRELQSDNKLQADKISELIALVKSQSKEFKDMKKDIKAELKAEMLEEYHKLKLAEKQNSQNNDQSRSNGHSMG